MTESQAGAAAPRNMSVAEAFDVVEPFMVPTLLARRAEAEHTLIVETRDRYDFGLATSLAVALLIGSRAVAPSDQLDIVCLAPTVRQAKAFLDSVVKKCKAILAEHSIDSKIVVFDKNMSITLQHSDGSMTKIICISPTKANMRGVYADEWIMWETEWMDAECCVNIYVAALMKKGVNVTAFFGRNGSPIVREKMMSGEGVVIYDRREKRLADEPEERPKRTKSK